MNKGFSSPENISGNGSRIAVVASRFNPSICDALLEGAQRALKERQVREDDIAIVRVPGAFEIPFMVRKLIQSRSYDGIICIGAIIRGDTPHFDFIAGECARGIMDANSVGDIPVIFGIITCNTFAQAEERSRPDNTNKGYEAALSAIAMITNAKNF